MSEIADVIIEQMDCYTATDKLEVFVRDLFDMRPTELEQLLAASERGLAVVKPNWVQQSHELLPDIWEPVITHPSIIIAVVRVLAEKMGGRGTICICDAPITHADFATLICRGDLRDQLIRIQRDWPDMRIEILDLRREVWETKEQVVVRRNPNPPDPRGYVRLNLGKQSLFFGHRGEGRYYGADYDTKVVNQHHHGAIQEYLLAGTPIQCDLFINLPKLKTHKKTGITCCLKNLVGINGDKNWLPHHTQGSPQSHGDEFPAMPFVVRAERTIKKAGQTIALKMPIVGPWIYRKMRSAGKSVLGDSETSVRNGNWQGNDTCWRMALDLNRALLFGKSTGEWGTSRKPYISIVDGVVGGQGNGPLCPDPAPSKVIFGGWDPACVDAVACRLAGFAPETIPIVRHAFDSHIWRIGTKTLDDVLVFDRRSNSYQKQEELATVVPGGFRPHFGWRGLTHQ